VPFFQALRKLVQQPDPEVDKATDKKAQEAVQRTKEVKEAALKCLLRILAALDAWVAPLKESMLKAAELEGLGGVDSSNSLQVGLRGTMYSWQ
jgi:hypothetical protein